METNKVFELVEYLYSQRENITSYKKVVEKGKRLGNELYSLKPKSPLADDTLYNKKQKELDEHVANSKALEFLEKHRNKITELGFTLNIDYTIPWHSYRKEFKNVIDNWANNATDKIEARKQLAECKRQHNELLTEEMQFVLPWIEGFFFGYLNEFLKETFDKHLGKKYNDLSNDLKPFLERYDADVIESIIDSKQLPYGAEKPIWKRQADAHVFSDNFKIAVKDMNEMFRFKNGKGDIIDKLKHNTKSKSENSYLADILTRHSV